MHPDENRKQEVALLSQWHARGEDLVCMIAIQYILYIIALSIK